MGTSVAVTFACIYISMIELECFSKCKLIKPNFIEPELCKRFIDDGISIWQVKQDATLFMETLQKIRPTLSFTWNINDSIGTFLDLTLYKGPNFLLDGRIDSTLYQKPTNNYQYLPSSSFHSKHIFKNFILAELRRYLINCSNPFDFLNLRKLFFVRLQNRGYNVNFLTRLFDTFPSQLRSLHTLRNEIITLLINKDKTVSTQACRFPLVYKTTLNPVHSSLKLKKCITPLTDSYIYWDHTWRKISNNNNIIICYKNNKSIYQLLRK